MKLIRKKRIALELLGPPALGAGILSIFFTGVATWEIVVHDKAVGKTLSELGSAILICVIMAYVFAGVQSILYTAIMEWRFHGGLDPRSWRMVWWSSALGFASGAGMIVAFGEVSVSHIAGCFFWGGLGFVVGFLMGLLIRWSSKSAGFREKNPP